MFLWHSAREINNTMNKISRILIFVSALMLIGVYFLPLWSITLDAPQYPEGLGMQIWINKITGDLRTINGLNHYIGMKTINPESIPELKWMPYILCFLFIFGIAVAFFKKKSLLIVWISLMLLAGIVGAYDFWSWEYDYGHNLDPSAAIKVPGMNYQPPLIGSKKLLNFTASSFPDAGGILIFISGIIAIAVLYYEFKLNKLKND